MPPLLIALAIAAAVALDMYLVWRLRGRRVPAICVGPLRRLRASPRLGEVGEFPIRSERTVGFVVGCAFIVVAHVFFFVVPPLFQLYRLAEWLNSLLLLNLVNPINTIVGGSLLVVGIVLVVRAVKPSLYPDPPLLEDARPHPSIRRLDPKILAVMLLGVAMLLTIVLWQLSFDEPPDYLPFLWASALMLTAIAAWNFDRRQKRTLRPTADRWDVLILLALVAGGLAIGTYRLGSIPFSMVGDEGSFFEVASSIATAKLRPSFFGFGVYSYPIVASLYQGLVLRIFGLSLWSWRFASVLIAVAATIPTYLLARELFDRRLAFLSGALMLVMPYFIAIERLGYNNSQALLPVALAVYLIYAGLRRSSIVYLVLGGMAAGLGFYTYTAGRLGIVVTLIFILLVLLVRREHRIRFGVLLLGTFVFSFLITSIPHLYHGRATDSLSLGYKTFESLFPNTDYALDLYEIEALEQDLPLLEVGANSFFYRLDLYAQLLLRGVLRTGLALSHPELITSHYIAAPLAGPLGGIFLVVGFALALAGYRQRNFQLVLIWMLAGLLLLSALNTFPPRHLHLVPIIPAMAILIAVGLATLSEFLVGLLPKQRKIYATGLGIVGLLLLSVTGLRNYFTTAQYRHPPNVEDLIAFTALQLEAPRELIYISSNPELLEFEPWLLSRIPNVASYRNVDVRSLSNVELSNRSAVTIFFEEQNSSEVREWVESSVGERAALESHRSQGRMERTLTYSFDPGSAPSDPGQKLSVSEDLLVIGAAFAWSFALIFTVWRRFLRPRWFKEVGALSAEQRPSKSDRKAGRVASWLNLSAPKTFLRSLHFQLGSSATGTPSSSLWQWKTFGELALVWLVILVFSTQFLDPDPQQLLPGQEYGVLSYPDQVLVNSLDNHGTFPLWNPYIRSGHPYLGDPFAHPLNILSTVPVLLLGVANGYKVAVLLSLMLAGLSMWSLGGVLGFDRATRVWSAALYALNGQAIARFIQGQYIFIFGYAWIPFVFAALLLSLRTRSRRHYALTALALAMLYFTGTSYYPFYMTLIFAGIGVALLIEGGRVRSSGELWTRIRPIALVAILTLGLVAIQLLPALELRPHILKPGDPDLRLSMPLRETIVSFFSPSTSRSELLVQLPPQEFYAYVGWFPVLAAVLAIPAARYGRHRKEILGFALLLAFALLWSSIAYTPLAPAYRQVPLFHQFRYTSRTLILGVLALLSLGGLGLSWVMGRLQGEAARSQKSRLTHAGLLLLMIVSVVTVFRENLGFVRTRPLNAELDKSVSLLAEQTSNVADVSIPLSTGWHIAAASHGIRYWDAWYGFDFFPPTAPTTWRFRKAPNYLLQPGDLEVYHDDAQARNVSDSNVVYELEGSLPFAFTVAGPSLQPLDGFEIGREDVVPAKATEISANEIRVHGLDAAASGWVVVRTNYFPGWTATVDGESKQLEAVGEFIGTRVVPGASEYLFRFQPPILKSGLAITAYTLFVIILIFVEPSIRTDGVRSRFLAARSVVARLAQKVRGRG